MGSPTGPDRAGVAHVLLVDLNKSGLAARRTVLEELGHRVTTASCGEDALLHFSKAKFDLVITDHRMAKLNGTELIKKLRAVEPAMPVIMISAYVDALGLNESNTGANLVLAKSANEVAHLIRGVARLLRQKSKAKKKPPASLGGSALKARRQTS